MLANALGSGPKSFLNATITIAGPPPPPIQPGATASGCCGVTLVCGKADCCNVQAKGSWDASALNISTLAECVAHAKANCPKANYVSFAKPQDDCSWFETTHQLSGLCVCADTLTQELPARFGAGTVIATCATCSGRATGRGSRR
eukprot:COSAG06_NODE_8390_length_2188_cov_3.692610_3_plen_145_part_00